MSNFSDSARKKLSDEPSPIKSNDMVSLGQVSFKVLIASIAISCPLVSCIRRAITMILNLLLRLFGLLALCFTWCVKIPLCMIVDLIPVLSSREEYAAFEMANIQFILEVFCGIPIVS